MFDENFSFLSSTSNTTSPPSGDCTSSEVSPFTSRSSSPGPYHRHTSISARSCRTLTRRDSRFNSVTSTPRTSSITALTAKLETHALTSAAEPGLIAASPTSISPTTPAYSEFSDEGFVEGNIAIDEYDPSLWDLSTSDLNITSSPRNSFGGGLNNLPSFAMRRRQRQALVRLQCLAQRTPDLMMLIEECHPSSMPLPSEPVWGLGASRQHSTSNSTSSSGSTRVEKACAVVKRMPRMRKRAIS